METLAAYAGGDGELWAVMGLLSAVDSEYAAHNPQARGKVASQQAALEGLDSDLCAALRYQACGRKVERIQGALALTWALLERVPRRGIESQRVALMERLTRELELERGRGDALSDRLDVGMDALGLKAPGGDLSPWIDGALEALIALGGERP
ncbi:MAG: hypothetical protein JRH20_04745 [Deltaproteobacteria bacterium]|nr:hypothetical protein [Deltaproteobacteria bacterium]